MATRTRIGRNEACPCGSGDKFKRCHGRPVNSQIVPMIKQFIDSGETPVRWAISNQKGTAFFVDKQGRILVFADKQVAVDVAHMSLFSAQTENEINIAGIGPTKWQHLQETLPYVEVASFGVAEALIKERVDAQMANMQISGEIQENTTTN